MKSSLSILGMYNWDNSLFQGMTVPYTVDKEALIYNILLKCAEFELIYPVPSVMKKAIEIWSISRKKYWDKIAEALNEQYRTTDNYHKHEEEYIGSRGTNSYKNSGTGDNYTAAFNIDSMSPSTSNESTDKGEGETTNCVDRETETRGNAGFRTYQSIIKSEIDLRSRYSIEDIIINEFKTEFCILVY